MWHSFSILLSFVLIELSVQSCEKKAALTECSGMTITSNTIRNISPDTVVLSIKQGLRESTIHAGTFQTLPNLEKLFLNSADIGSLERGSFRGLANLRELHLTNNQIDEISREVLDSCRRLDVLNLNLNKITNIDNKAFSELAALEELDLSSNLLEQVPNLEFQVSLKKLNLGYNKLTVISSGAFSNLNRLTVLKLNDNKLTALEPNALRGLRNLRELDIKVNYVRDLDVRNIFQTCSRLQKVAISVNNFQCDRLRNILNEFRQRRVQVEEGVSQSKDSIDGISCKV